MYTQVDSKSGKVGMDFIQNFNQALAGAEVAPILIHSVIHNFLLIDVVHL